MKCWILVAVVILTGLLATSGAYALPAGSGGGAGGGGGGHGGGGHGGGHFSGHSFSGSGGGGIGHAIGHSFGRVFGRHNKGSASAHDLEPPVAGAALLHGKVVQLAGPRTIFSPGSRGFRHHHHDEFPFGDRFLFFPPGAGFGFGGCWDFGFPRHGFFGGEFDCFADGLFFDPLFIAGISGDYLGAQAFLPFNNEELNDTSDGPALAPAVESNADQLSAASGFTESSGIASNAAASNGMSAGIPKDQRPVTLMQLLDGSMYGLVDYWVEDGQLHYTTTYGGQDIIPLDRVDMVKTAELNEGRGIQFVPHAKAASQ